MPTPRIARVPAMRPSSGTLIVVFWRECFIFSRFHIAFSGFGGLPGFLSEHLRSFSSYSLHCGSMSRTGTALTSDTISLG